jgi:hypothetical protein
MSRSRKDFKDARPLDELLKELYQRGQAEQAALEREAQELGLPASRYSTYLDLAELFDRSRDPLFEVVEQAACSDPGAARIAAGILAQVKLEGRSTAEAEQWITQLEERLASEPDADLRTLLKAAVKNLSRQRPKKRPAKKKLAGCR